MYPLNQNTKGASSLSSFYHFLFFSSQDSTSFNEAAGPLIEKYMHIVFINLIHLKLTLSPKKMRQNIQ